MPALSNSVTRASAYSIGGVVTLFAWPTLTPEGLNSATYTYATDGSIATIVFDDNITPYRLEAEEDSMYFSDNVVIGANVFPKPVVGFKFAGRSDGLNKVAKALELTRHTYCLKLASGKIVVVGEQNGLKIEKSESGAGAKAEDFTGYDLVVAGQETNRARTVAADVYVGLLTDVDLTSPVTG